MPGPRHDVISEVAPHDAVGRVGAFPAGLAYTAYAAYRAVGTATTLPREDRGAFARQALRTLAAARGVALRGTYDTSGYGADAGLLVWLAAPAPDLLQDALASFRRTPLAAVLEPTWSGFALHSADEFPKNHVPAYYRGEGARRYVAISAITHTTEWYGLDTHERRRMLLDYTRAGRDYPDVRSNSLSAVGLGEHEWLFAFESEHLTRIVALARHLRGCEARAYTRHEEQLITGVRKPLGDILDALP